MVFLVNIVDVADAFDRIEAPRSLPCYQTPMEGPGPGSLAGVEAVVEEDCDVVEFFRDVSVSAGQREVEGPLGSGHAAVAEAAGGEFVGNGGGCG